MGFHPRSVVGEWRMAMCLPAEAGCYTGQAEREAAGTGVPCSEGTLLSSKCRPPLSASCDWGGGPPPGHLRSYGWASGPPPCSPKGAEDQAQRRGEETLVPPVHPPPRGGAPSCLVSLLLCVRHSNSVDSVA